MAPRWSRSSAESDGGAKGPQGQVVSVDAGYIVQRRPNILSDGAMDEWRALSERDFTRDSAAADGSMVPRSRNECAAWVMDRKQSSYRVSKFRVIRAPVA